MIPAADYKTPLKPWEKEHLRKNMGMMAARMEKTTGLSPKAAKCLLVIATQERSNVSNVTRELKMAAATVKRYLSGLKDKGYIILWSDREDLRTKRIHLTTKGVECCREMTRMAERKCGG